ncbi:MAG: GNAT family N-acetyltransferase [Cyclobacteriaceae bacterium]|nr:GNAT family N-acetyltransferase [Cyclobacteriaceae bacterium HetDA_MAG_MS6]
MNFQVLANTKVSDIRASDLLFYSEEYLASHNSQDFFIAKGSIDTGTIHFIFEKDEGIARSFSNAPFGSFWISGTANLGHFKNFLDNLQDYLGDIGCHTIRIVHPPVLYAGFVPLDWLDASGFQKVFDDDNQFIDLSIDAVLHDMESRKIRKGIQQGLEVQEVKDFKKLHRFLNECRQSQSLEINISEATLLQQVNSMPDHYEGYAVYKNDQMISAVVITIVSQKVAYYYLPGTLPDFKKLSPMAILVSYLTEKYKYQGFKVFDLGVSSKQGKRQEGLFAFKRHMGAESTKRTTFNLQF